MSIEIGTYGVWQRSGAVDPETAAEIESLGYGALWIGGSPAGELAEIDPILEATESLVVATGIVNMWRDDAATVAQSYHRINDRYPDRFLLGVGIGHPEATSEYRRPYDTIVSYVDDLDGAGVPQQHVALAALGPKVLRLSAERTAGAHPYLTTPRHTTFAREVMGNGPLLAPEQTVVLGPDPEESHQIAAEFVSRYLRLVNYRNNLVREGWEHSDLTGGGSDRLISELVLSGTAKDVAGGIRAHVDAGADHVCIQDVGPDPMGSLRSLAGILFG
jgi:probable F420-dependent oxidoreductase